MIMHNVEFLSYVRTRKQVRGPLGWFYRGFNRVFGSATHGYVNWSRAAIRKAVLSFALLFVLAMGAGFFGQRHRIPDMVRMPVSQ